MSIPQISELPPPPQRNDSPNDFVAKADAHVASLGQFVTQTNQVVSNINQISPQVADDSALASASAASAAGIANYKGLWSSLSGALNVPASVKHKGSFYFLVNNLADVTASEPSSSSDWQLIVNAGNIRKSLLDSPLCRLFCPNKLVDTLAGPLTWTRASTATYVDRYGVVRTAAIDEPREESEGWLIEGVSTNLLTYSEEFDNAAWLKGGVTVTPNAANAPDTNLTAYNANISQSGFLAQIAQLTVGQQYTLSVWVKSATGTDQEFRLYGCDGIFSAFLTATQEWRRFSFTFTATSAASHGLTAPISGDCSIYVWGAQLEQLPFASSYIPTTTAPATRAGDSVSAEPDQNLPETSQGFTFTASVNVLGRTTNAGFGKLQAAFSSDALVYFAHNGFISGDASSCTVMGTGNQLILSTQNSQQVVITSESGSQALYDAGIQKATSSVASVSTGRARLALGNGGSVGNNPLYGHLRDFRIYDFALNADEAAFLSGVK